MGKTPKVRAGAGTGPLVGKRAKVRPGVGGKEMMGAAADKAWMEKWRVQLKIARVSRRGRATGLACVPMCACVRYADLSGFVFDCVRA